MKIESFHHGILLWLGQDFGHTTIKEDILPMGSQESMGVEEVWPLSIRGEFFLGACPRRGRWQEKENIVSLPYNWPFIVRCYQAYKAF